jgi:hypothetical protein
MISLLWAVSDVSLNGNDSIAQGFNQAFLRSKSPPKGNGRKKMSPSQGQVFPLLKFKLSLSTG